MPDGSEDFGRVVHISDLSLRHAFEETMIHLHYGLHRRLLVSHVQLSLHVLILSCVYVTIRVIGPFGSSARPPRPRRRPAGPPTWRNAKANKQETILSQHDKLVEALFFICGGGLA